MKGLSSKATERLLADLAVELERRHGVRIRFESAGGVDVARRIREGEAADVLVLADDALSALAGEGSVVADSVRPLFVSDVVLAVCEPGPLPVLDSEDQLVRLLRGAAGIGYSTGPSGAAFLRRLDGWGLGDELADRLVLAPPGTPVASLIADGRVSVGIQQRSELTGAAGVQVVGPLPGDAAIRSTFSGGVPVRSDRYDEALSALDLLAGDDVADVVRASSLEPA